MMKKLNAVVAPCALVLALAGCTSTDSDDSKSSSASAPSASSSSSARDSSSSAAPSPSSSSSSSSESSAALPDGTQRVTAPRSGISFAVPKGWQKMDPSSLSSPQARARIEEMAKKMGMTADEFVKQYSQTTELMYIGNVWGKSAGTVNVTTTLATTLPSQSDLDAQISRIGAKTTSFKSIDTPLGKGVEDQYTVSVSGVEAHGVMVVVPNSHGTMSVITFSGGDAAKLGQYADDAVKSLQKS